VISPNGVSALNSHAVMATEVSDLRKELRDLLGACKKAAPALPANERGELIDQMLKAELRTK